MRYPSPPGAGERVNHRSAIHANKRFDASVPAFTFEGWYGLLISRVKAPAARRAVSRRAIKSSRGATASAECYILPALETS
jgi:hypothetical protein